MLPRRGDPVGEEAAVGPEQPEEERRPDDERDSGRTTAPLKPAEDALLLDTGDLTIGAAVQAAIALVESKLRGR